MKERFYVSDIRKDLLFSNLDNKRVIDTFGRYFEKETLANNFIRENPYNTKYIIKTEKNKILGLEIKE